MLNIILFGAPGCGKGTQAQRLAEHYDLYHISTGEVIRGEIKAGTELGRSMESYISRGELAPDSIVVEMVRNYMASHSDKAASSTASHAQQRRRRSSTRCSRRLIRRLQQWCSWTFLRRSSCVASCFVARTQAVPTTRRRRLFATA